MTNPRKCRLGGFPKSTVLGPILSIIIYTDVPNLPVLEERTVVGCANGTLLAVIASWKSKVEASHWTNAASTGEH